MRAREFWMGLWCPRAASAVVEPGADDAASDGIRHSTVQHWSDVPQCSNVEVAGLDDALYMLVEGQALVECDSKALQRL